MENEAEIIDVCSRCGGVLIEKNHKEWIDTCNCGPIPQADGDGTETE